MRLSSRPISATARRRSSERRMDSSPLLDVQGLYAGYGETKVLRGVELSVSPGEIVAEPFVDRQGLYAGYGETKVLRGVELSVSPGEIVAVLGSNGVGKSTLNRTISGVVRARAGSIRLDGAAVEREKPSTIVARGLIHVPEGRRIFPNLSVRENLDLGSYRRATERRAANRNRVFTIFPRLYERQLQGAGTLSGGEQQMLAIGRR